MTLRPRRARGGWLLSANALLILSWAAPLRAACDPPLQPWIALQFVGAHHAAFARAVSEDIRAGIDEQTQVCPLSAADADPPRAVIEIEIEARGAASVSVNVDVKDGGLSSHVSRDVELAGLPPDSRAFAVALAVNELLAADWVGPAPDSESPTPPARDVADDTPREPVPVVAPSARPPWRLGLGAAAEHFLNGQTQWGADAGLRLAVHDRIGLRAAAGVRQGLEVEAPHGRVSSRALSWMGDVVYSIWKRPVELGVGLGAHAEWLQLSGLTTDASTRARDFSGLALYVRASVSATFHLLGPVWLEAVGSGGVPLRGLEATDSGETASGMSGVQLASTVGVLVEL